MVAGALAVFAMLSGNRIFASYLAYSVCPVGELKSW
jgi:hypothetical protein